MEILRKAENRTEAYALPDHDRQALRFYTEEADPYRHEIVARNLARAQEAAA